MDSRLSRKSILLDHIFKKDSGRVWASVSRLSQSQWLMPCGKRTSIYSWMCTLRSNSGQDIKAKIDWKHLTVLNMTTTRSRRESHEDNPINDLIKTLNVSNQSILIKHYHLKWHQPKRVPSQWVLLWSRDGVFICTSIKTSTSRKIVNTVYIAINLWDHLSNIDSAACFGAKVNHCGRLYTSLYGCQPGGFATDSAKKGSAQSICDGISKYADREYASWR